MALFLTIYAIGFVCTWAFTKMVIRERHENSWEDVSTTLVFSLFSWVGFVIALIFAVVKHYEEPPKWL